MPYPNIPDKYKYASLVTAKQDRKNRIFAVYDEQYTNTGERMPEKVIFTYGQFANDAVKSHIVFTKLNDAPAYRVDPGDMLTTSLITFPAFYGSTMTALRMEELIEAGVKEFIIAGWAGTLKRDLGCGQIIICDRAIRDEGVSHHYIKPGKYVSADKTLVKELLTYARELGIPAKVGTTWTTSAPFRETAEEVKAYSDEGALTVEMEAATCFAIAKRYNVKAAAVFVTLDSLAELIWKPLGSLPLKQVPIALHLASKGKFMPCGEETPLDKKLVRRLEDVLAIR